MKRGIVAILAVAIIGALGVYGKSHSSTAQSASNDSSVQSDTNSAQAPQTPDTSNSSNQPSAGAFKDGTYTGDSEDTVYGTVQIAVVVSGGRITNVNFLQMPNDQGHTQEVTAFAKPLLKQETLQKQSAHVDFVSGATQTSEGYQQSLQSALDQAA
jgi:uncharacterized protein with FMN-binding domain